MKRAVSTLLVVIVFVSSLCTVSVKAADYSSYDFRTTANDIVNWKKNAEGTGNCLFTDKFTQSISQNSGGEWYACYMGRFGFEDYPQRFLDAITAYVISKYNENGTLSDTYATDYHKIALAVISAGGNPYNVSGVNLIADGVYNRENTASLGRQGINGWIWGLIALDSLNTQIPNGSCYTREEIITEILKYQLKDGGFSAVATGAKSDVDTTAMALYALAPYQHDNIQYTYVPKYDRKNISVTKTVGQVINEALIFLSDAQQSDGSYASFGTVNSESISQVIIALCSLGVNPQTDTRFVKNRSLIDAFMSFKNNDGGFSHEYGTPSNPMASEQALGAVAALDRLYSGGTRLFDFTDGVTMKTFTPSISSEQPTIPVPQSPAISTSSGSSNSNTSTQNSSVSHSAPSVSTSSGTASITSSSSAVGGTAGSTVTATEKATEKSTDKSTAAAASTTNSNISSADNALTNQSNILAADSSGLIAQDIEEHKSLINPIVFILLGVILIAVLTSGYFIYRKKKMSKIQNIEDSRTNTINTVEEKPDNHNDENATQGEIADEEIETDKQSESEIFGDENGFTLEE